MARGVLLKLFTCLLYIACDVLDAQEFTSLKSAAKIYRYRRSTDGCILPPHPKNGVWILQNGFGSEGEKVNSSSILVFECRKGYRLSVKSPYVICLGKWNIDTMPECLKLCPPVTSTGTTLVKCTSKTREDVGCHEATQDTYMSYTCAPFYEAPFGYKTTSLCLDGEWNSPPPICQPTCGKKVHDDTRPLIFNGIPQTVIEYPWVAVLFSKNPDGTYMNVCGGSILNQKLVLTAAHCVTNGYGDVLSNDLFQVGAGKLFNKFKDSRDTEAQYFEVAKVIVHPTYRGESKRFQADIALLVISGRFSLNKFVQPVCLSDAIAQGPLVGTPGVVAGFGLKEGNTPSDELRILEIPYKSEETCVRELPGDWGDRYKLIDKICAGFYNQSTAICRGDSGNGLFFRNKENNRYYVHGVVSVGHTMKGQCDIQQNSLYTRVASHLDFVERELAKYYIKDCTLPSYPENGKWTIDNSDKKPGDITQSSTVLEIRCNDGYRLSSDISHFTCESSFVMPTCERLCPTLNLRWDHSCKTKGGASIHCNEATENAVLTFKCGGSYKLPDGTTNTRKCLNGVWEAPDISCERVDTTTSDDDDVEPYQKVTCIYDGKSYENGVKPDDINATLCDYVIYNSVGLTHDGKLRYKRETDVGYQSVADLKKKNPRLKVLLSVYGFAKNESDEYPTMAADAVTRSTFISNVIEFLDTFNFDGLNVHWDTPKKEEKYLQLLKEIKAAFAVRSWLLSVTIYFTPIYLGYEPQNLHRVVDWLNLESYNMYDEFSKYTGQPSALYQSSVENDFEQNYLNVKNSAYSWESYGVPRNKISLGVAFFGRYFTLKNPRRHGLHAPTTGSTNISDTGLVSYAKICEEYKDWRRMWDDEQKNPYKYHGNKWVGYDDEESINLKAAYAQKYDYFGVTVKSVEQDDIYGKCGVKYALMKKVHEGLGTDIPLLD